MKKFDDIALIEEYQKCERCRIVAEKFGCSEETVRRALIKYDVPRTKRHPRPVTRKRATEEELKEIVEEYYRTDVTINDLAAKYRRAQNTVSNAIKKYGHGLKKNAVNGRKITDEQILESVETMTRQEIADEYGVHVENLARRMRKLGVHAVYAKSQSRTVFGECWHFIESQKEEFEKLHPDFEYLETRNTGNATRVRLRCKMCGQIIERAASTIRKKGIRCDSCKEIKQLHEGRAKVARIFCAIKDAKTPKICAGCGDTFYSTNPKKKYCSDKCKHKSKRRSGSYRGRCKKYNVLYDPTVRRDAVLKRDQYICQICGKVCDPNDKRWGTSGPDFPTLDHIFPLAKGGTHTWDNVQCACGICNSNKRDLIEVS